MQVTGGLADKLHSAPLTTELLSNALETIHIHPPHCINEFKAHHPLLESHWEVCDSVGRGRGEAQCALFHQWLEKKGDF